MQPEIEDLIIRVQRNLRLAGCDHDAANSRACYAMFYPAEATLLSRGVTRSGHSGVISALNEYFVSAGLLPDIPAGALTGTFDQHNQADYGSEAISEQQACTMFQDSERLVSAWAPCSKAS